MHKVYSECTNNFKEIKDINKNKYGQTQIPPKLDIVIELAFTV